MQNIFTRFFQDESGATAIEYGLLAALISVAAVVTMGLVGEGLIATFTTVEGHLNP